MLQKQPLRHLIVAVQLMTRLPTPALADYSSDDAIKAANWVPATGVLIGCLLASVSAAASVLGPILTGLLVLLVWVWVTGALHLDGLADSADGLAAAHGGVDRFLAAARDPHIGAFGAVALILVLVAKFSLLTSAEVPPLSMVFALMLIPPAARLVASLAAFALPSLAEGRGAYFKQGLGSRALCAWTVAIGGTAILVAPAIAIAGAMAAFLAVWYWRRALGGMTGDTVGASIEITECAMLMAFAAMPFSFVL